jgi:S-adenosylmethionine:tRNA ribosyltransferase-isomerase
VDTAAFDYDLPPGRIAQVPVDPRDAARLLVDRGGVPPDHAHVADLPDLLAPGDVVVVNDTRVLPARLHLRKATGGAVEVLLLERGADGWEALVRPSRRVPPGTDLEPVAPAGHAGFGVRVHEDRGEGRRRVELTGVPETLGGDRVSAELDVLRALGEVPLPPYITTPLADPDRYQTIYARRPASAAAPTAGLHLTDAVLARLRDRGVTVAPVELVVGLDTFRPIAAEQVEDHKMHSEAYRVPPATWATVTAARAAGGEVVAIGTTAVRALESAAARGELEGRTDLYLHGDHDFAVVDRLLTNFHTPRSSLLVLVDAFVGPRWRRLYAEALAADYRFLSFGDAMLLSRNGTRGVEG